MRLGTSAYLSSPSPALARPGVPFGADPVILGLGTDIIEVVRIGEMIERHGELFLQRVYTEQEIRYCQRRKGAMQNYAGRWAAKEAVMKALGTGFSKGVGFKDIEVCSRKSGAPYIELHGGAKEVARRLGIDQMLVTISHCRAYATATAVALQHTPPAPA